MKYIDLHTHTFYSDGLYTPTILVQSLALNGIDVISKTDHDTLEGWEETEKEADRWGIIAVPGVELSTTNYHILGYSFTVENYRFKDFKKFVDGSRELQRENCRRRVDILARHGLPITFEKVQARFPKSRLGKMNVFMTLLTDEECREYLREHHKDAPPEKIKALYLGKGGNIDRDYSPVDLSPEEVIDAIHSAGGLAILAHPGRDIKKMEELDVLRGQGIDGLEISLNFYESYPPYEEYAKEHGLLITYGSDYHDATMNRPFLGRGRNILSPELEVRLLYGFRG